jgi:1,4-dihydroxy-2-naphthoate octaprenyltransferase
VLFLVTIPLAIKASRIVLKNPENVRALIPAQALTIQIHLLGGLLLTVGIVLSTMLPF